MDNTSILILLAIIALTVIVLAWLWWSLTRWYRDLKVKAAALERREETLRQMEAEAALKAGPTQDRD
jgi:nitrogen fixation-related uncharacterized protein